MNLPQFLSAVAVAMAIAVAVAIAVAIAVAVAIAIAVAVAVAVAVAIAIAIAAAVAVAVAIAIAVQGRPLAAPPLLDANVADENHHILQPDKKVERRTSYDPLPKHIPAQSYDLGSPSAFV